MAICGMNAMGFGRGGGIKSRYSALLARSVLGPVLTESPRVRFNYYYTYWMEKVHVRFRSGAWHGLEGR